MELWCFHLIIIRTQISTNSVRQWELIYYVDKAQHSYYAAEKQFQVQSFALGLGDPDARRLNLIGHSLLLGLLQV